MKNGEVSFKGALLTRCQADASGSFFLATNDNRSAQVVLQEGKLLGVNYLGLPAVDALEALLAMSGLRHTFQAELLYPLHETLQPGLTESLLQRLKVESEEAEVTKRESIALERSECVQNDSVETHAKVLMYRGQKVIKEVSHTSRTGIRIYRGQRIEG